MDSAIAAASRALLSRYPGGLRPAWRGCGRETGAVVAFEGIDGSGLTTHSSALAAALGEALARGCGRGCRVVRGKEPTGGPVGSLIRDILAGRANGAHRSPEVLALLFAADRAAHVASLVSAAFTSPTIVVLDRYKYSSAAYQGTLLGGWGRRWVLLANAYAPPPHLLVYLDVDPLVAYERVRRRGPGAQLYEDPSTLARVREGFLELLSEVGEAEAEAAGGSWRWGLQPGAEPPWSARAPACAYPPGRYPRVLRLSTGSGGVEENAARIALEVAGALVSLGLLAPAAAGEG